MPRVRESELHRLIYDRSRGMAARFGRVVVGPGDDCALVHTDGPVVVTVDQLVEGRHFTPDTPVDLVARKAVARSISDIAAMGGVPEWSLGSGVIPEGYPHAAELTDALHRWAERWGAPMVGGDLAAAPAGAPLVLATTVGGSPHPTRGPVRRSTARPGDEVWVTGLLGNSLASGRHLTFEPRTAEAVWLCDVLGESLHAMIDVSDGLGRDAGRVALASGVRIEIDHAALPRHPDAVDPLAPVRDGEDYELCFTAAPGAALTAETPQGTRLTRIGRVVAGSGCFARIDGRLIDIGDLGWDHAP